MRILAMLVLAALAPKSDCGSKKEAAKPTPAVGSAVGSGSAAPAPVDEITSGPATDITARKLYEDYVANEVRADANYNGKVLRVTGIVKEIGKDIADDGYAELLAPHGGTVHVRFRDEAALAWLDKGQEVTIRCRCDGFSLGTPVLKDCVKENRADGSGSKR